jgi:hypothetical protein
VLHGLRLRLWVTPAHPRAHLIPAALIAILCTKNGEEMRALRTAYQEGGTPFAPSSQRALPTPNGGGASVAAVNNRAMESDVRSDTSGWYQKLLLALIEGTRVGMEQQSDREPRKGRKPMDASPAKGNDPPALPLSPARLSFFRTTAMPGKREEPNGVNFDLAKEDASRLYEAGEKRWGTGAFVRGREGGIGLPVFVATLFPLHFSPSDLCPPRDR